MLLHNSKSSILLRFARFQPLQFNLSYATPSIRYYETQSVRPQRPQPSVDAESVVLPATAPGRASRPPRLHVVPANRKHMLKSIEELTDDSTRVDGLSAHETQARRWMLAFTNILQTPHSELPKNSEKAHLLFELASNINSDMDGRVLGSFPFHVSSVERVIAAYMAVAWHAACDDPALFGLQLDEKQIKNESMKLKLVGQVMRQHLMTLLCIEYPIELDGAAGAEQSLLRRQFVMRIIQKAMLSDPQKVSPLLPALIYQWADLLALDTMFFEKSAAVRDLQLSRLDGVRVCTASIEAILHLQPKDANFFARNLALAAIEAIDSAEMVLGSVSCYVFKARTHWLLKFDLVRTFEKRFAATGVQVPSKVAGHLFLEAGNAYLKSAPGPTTEGVQNLMTLRTYFLHDMPRKEIDAILLQRLYHYLPNVANDVRENIIANYPPEKQEEVLYDGRVILTIITQAMVHKKHSVWYGVVSDLVDRYGKLGPTKYISSPMIETPKGLTQLERTSKNVQDSLRAFISRDQNVQMNTKLLTTWQKIVDQQQNIWNYAQEQRAKQQAGSRESKNE